MTKDNDWLRHRARALREHMRTLGVNVEVDNAREVIISGRRLFAAEQGISEIRARSLLTDDVLRVAAAELEKTVSAPARDSIASTEGKRLEARSAQMALIGLLEVALDLNDDGDFAAGPAIQLAMDVAGTISNQLSTDDRVLMPGPIVRKLYETLREGAARVLGNDEPPFAEETMCLHAFLTRLSNGIAGAPDRAHEL